MVDKQLWQINFRVSDWAEFDRKGEHTFYAADEDEANKRYLAFPEEYEESTISAKVKLVSLERVV